MPVKLLVVGFAIVQNKEYSYYEGCKLKVKAYAEEHGNREVERISALHRHKKTIRYWRSSKEELKKWGRLTMTTMTIKRKKKKEVQMTIFRDFKGQFGF